MREHDVEGARGLRLCVCAWGEPRPDRPPVLLLHGYLEQGAAWDDVARRLSGRVVAPDHRGHGRSGHVGVGGFYHFWDYVADVDAVVRWIGGPVDLVGHSMGGTIACLYAGARPESVRRLVLIEGLGPPDLTPIALERSRRYLDAMAAPPDHSPMPDVAAAAARMRRHNPRLGPETALRLATRITRPTEGGVTWTWDALHRSASPNPFDPRQFRTWVEAIRAPVLYLDGSDSPFRVPDLDDRAGWIGDLTRETIPGAGHLVHHDAPDVLADRLATWFEASP